MVKIKGRRQFRRNTEKDKHYKHGGNIIDYRLRQCATYLPATMTAEIIEEDAEYGDKPELSIR